MCRMSLTFSASLKDKSAFRQSGGTARTELARRSGSIVVIINCSKRPSSIYIRLRRSRSSPEKLKIASFVRLRAFVGKQLSVSALVPVFRRPPLLTTVGQFFVRDAQMNPTSLHVQFDHIAVSHQRQRPAHRGFGRNVQYAGSVARAAHGGIADAH